MIRLLPVLALLLSAFPARALAPIAARRAVVARPGMSLAHRARLAPRSGSPVSLASSRDRGDTRRISQALRAPNQAFDGSKADWTWMVFLNGHNNLDQFGKMNISQMERVGSSQRLNMVVQWASSANPDTRRLLVHKAPAGAGEVVTSPTIETVKRVDMGDVNQLVAFAKWASERFPAKRYMLDIWNHGSGWRLNGRPRGPVPEDVSSDDHTGNVIKTEQLGPALAAIKAILGQPLDVIAFDACLMAMMEVASEVAPHVRYMTASQEVEPGQGWPYTEVADRWLATSPDDDGRASTAGLAEEYTRSYSPGGSYPKQDVTHSAWDLSQVGKVQLAADALSDALGSADPAKVLLAAQNAQSYSYSDYRDLVNFVRNLREQGVVPEQAAAVEAAVSSLIVANHVTPRYARSNGASVWLPTSAGTWNAHRQRYQGLNWDAGSAWSTVIAHYLKK